MVAQWRMNLQPASLDGVVFHVDINARSGGRRNALHEFPKKDAPYDEDMGRRARKFPVTGYIIGPDYTSGRDDMLSVLEAEGPHQLVLPTALNADVQSVNVDTYSMTERRERGGIVEFDINFVEAGSSDFTQNVTDTQSAAVGAAQTAVPQFQQSAAAETVST
jgi:prophage DNA circulation protein